MRDSGVYLQTTDVNTKRKMTASNPIYDNCEWAIEGCMGGNRGRGRGDKSPPRIWSGGMLTRIVPSHSVMFQNLKHQIAQSIST